MKYLISLGVVVVIVVGYFLLAPSPSAVVSQNDPITTAQVEKSVEYMVALKRESLPTALSDTVTLNDAVFFPRMRIMEYVYVSATPNVDNLQTFIEGRTEMLCLEVRDMFGKEVILRNSFEDIDGNVLRRIYLLEEDCQRFY
ncbi:MAG: hypothetical protein ACSHXW_08730 [Yoonia sp.]